MSVDDEVEEHVQHARDPFDRIVAGSMAIIAACLAVVSVLGQHYNTEKLLAQQEASDEWAYYNAKDIRHYTARLSRDVLTQLKATPDLVKQYAADEKRYKGETAEIQEKAREFERERDKMGHEADSFHLGEVFLEIAIVFSSLSILAKRRVLFFGGLVSAGAGFLFALSGYIYYGVLPHK